MDSFDVILIPFAMLISLISEDADDKKLSQAAKEFMTKKVKSRNISVANKDDIYAVNAITLKHPVLIPGLREGKVQGKDLAINFKMKDVKVLDVGDFTTKKQKKCCLTLEFDFVKVVGRYTIDGSVNGNDFQGGGTADITLRDVSSEAKVDHTFDEDEVKINHLNFDFDFKMLEFEQTGLAIKDVSKSEVRRILNAVGKVYFKQNMKIVSRKLSETIKDRFNAILKGKNRDQIVELLHRGHFKL